MKTAARLLLALLLVVSLTAGQVRSLDASPIPVADTCCGEQVCPSKCCISRDAAPAPLPQPALPAPHGTGHDWQAALVLLPFEQLQPLAPRPPAIVCVPVFPHSAAPVPLFLRTHSFLI